jgi:hypothetical protein
MVKWQDVSKLLGSGIGIVGLFAGLFLLTGIDYTYTGDIECGETCESYINITTSYWRVCFDNYNGTKYENESILFKKRARSRTLHVDLNRVDNIIQTEPKVEADWLVPARGAGNWRPIKGGDCWERGKVNKIKLVGHKEPTQNVKWSFILGDKVDIDPMWNGINLSKYGCTELLVSTSDTIHSKINKSLWTKQMFEEEKKGNTKQGYILDAKPCVQILINNNSINNNSVEDDTPINMTLNGTYKNIWGNLETDPKRAMIVRINSSEFNESWFEPEYTKGNITKMRKYKFNVYGILTGQEGYDLRNIKYNQGVNWSLEKDVSNVENFIEYNNWSNRSDLKLHGSSGNFTICPSGCNYTSLSNFEATENADLNGTGPAIAIITEGFTENLGTSRLSISGWTTTSDDYIEIKTSENARHKGVFNSENYLLTSNVIASPEATLYIDEQYVIIDGLQIKYNATSNGDVIINEAGSEGLNNTSVTIKNNILFGNDGVASRTGISSNAVASTAFIYNNIIYDMDNNGILINGGSNWTIYNNIIFNIYNFNGNSINAQNGNATVRNNICEMPFGDCYTGNFLDESSNNIASDNTAPGPNSFNSTIITYVNSTVRNFNSINSSQININNGTTINLFDTDIIGTIRPQGSAWDIGAFEFTILEANFVSPTPANGTTTSNTSIQIRTNITNATYLDEVIFNWNGTNTSFYDDSLVLMMNLDNVETLGESDTLAVDVSIYEGNGLISGAAFNSSGKYNGAYNFNGTTYIEIPDTGNPDLSINESEDGYSVFLWIYPTDTATNRWIMSKSSGSEYEWALATTSGNLGFNGWTCGGSNVVSGSGGSLQDNQWQYIGFIWNKANFTTYIDGEFAAVDTTFSNAFGDCAAGVQLGRRGDDAGNKWEGMIDEPRIYNRSLTSDEIQQLYMSNLNKYDINAWSLYVNQSKNSTAGLDNGTYTYQTFAHDNLGVDASTDKRTIIIGEEAPSDNEYPIFSNYDDNNATLIDSGIGIFNVTVINTNGTVILEIDGTNITATNLSTNVYNSSYTFSSPGVYPYRWHSWGNGTSANYNVSNEQSYAVIASIPINISFVNPTPPNDTTTTNTSIIINVSLLNASDLTNVIFNWNKTNYSIFDESLVLMYNFNNVSSLGENDSLVVDVSGYGNNGTVVGATWNASGRYGGAYEFDGINNQINIGTSVNNEINISNRVTIAAWVKSNIDDFSSGHLVIAGSAFENNIPFYLFVETTNRPRFTVRNNGTRCDVDTLSYTMPKDTWVYVTGIFNGTHNLIYINGILDDSQSCAFTELNIDEDDSFIGSRGGTAFWNGTIDEPRIWNRSLSSDEIQQLYFSNLNKYDPDKWALYVNQSKNSTNGLDDGVYTYQAFAQDDDWYQTEERIITISVDTCTYTSGNWNVLGSDNCVISTNVNGDSGANMTIDGVGTFTLDANITGFLNYYLLNGCNVTCRNGCFN